MSQHCEKIQDDARAKRIVLAIGSLILLCGLNTGWIGPLLPTIASDKGVSLSQAGSIVSLYCAGGIIPLLIGKMLIDKLGGKLLIQLAAFLMAVGLMIIGTGPIAPVITAGAFIMGFGGGVSSIAGNVLILSLNKETGASALSKLHLFFGVGALIGPLCAWAAMRTPFTYHIVYIGAALFAFLIGFMLWPLSNSTEREEEDCTSKARLDFSSVSLWLFNATIFLYVGIETAITAWLYTYLIRASHLSQDLSSMSMSFLWAGLSAGRLASVYLLRRLPVNSVIFSGMVTATFAMAWLCLCPELGALALPAVALMGIGFAPIFPGVLAVTTGRFRESTAQATAMIITAGALGGMALPYIAGTILDRLGAVPAMISMTLLFALQIGTFYVAAALSKARPKMKEPFPIGTSAEGWRSS